jgi:hypothetical protein
MPLEAVEEAKVEAEVVEHHRGQLPLPPLILLVLLQSQETQLIT